MPTTSDCETPLFLNRVDAAVTIHSYPHGTPNFDDVMLLGPRPTRPALRLAHAIATELSITRSLRFWEGSRYARHPNLVGIELSRTRRRLPTAKALAKAIKRASEPDDGSLSVSPFKVQAQLLGIAVMKRTCQRLELRPEYGLVAPLSATDEAAVRNLCHEQGVVGYLPTSQLCAFGWSVRHHGRYVGELATDGPFVTPGNPIEI